MNIGTAKPSQDELAVVPHFFVNNLSIQEDFSAGDFEKQALDKIKELFNDHDVVVMVGGSGLFINAVCQGLDDLPKPLPGIRDQLNNLHKEKGLSYLQQDLKLKDPDYYAEVDINNPQRVIRALEVYESTGKPFSFFRKDKPLDRPFRILKIGLNTDREVLYKRINHRVDEMMKAGLLKEVQTLLPYRHHAPLLTVGYVELFDYLDGKTTLTDAIEKIKQHTRQYAKRQITWFKKDANTTWFEPTQGTDIIQFINQERVS